MFRLCVASATDYSSPVIVDGKQSCKSMYLTKSMFWFPKDLFTKTGGRLILASM